MAPAAAPPRAAALVAPLAAGCEQAPFPQRIGLDQVIHRALCIDPRTRVTWAQWRAQQAAEDLELSNDRPQLGASLDIGTGSARTRDSSGTNRGRGRIGATSLDLQWVLVDFGQREARLDAARYTVAAAAANHDRTVQEVYLAAAQSYFKLVEAQNNLNFVRESERFTADVIDIAARPRPGKEPADRLGLLQARTALERIRLERRQAEGALLQARGELASRIGAPPSQALEALAPEPLPDSPEQLRQGEESVDELIRKAMSAHPELAEARARLGSAQAQWSAARRGSRPTLSAVASQRTSRDAFAEQDRTRSAGLQLSIPFTTWGQREAAERQARAQYEATQAELATAEQQTALDVWSAYQELGALSASIVQARQYQQAARQLLDAEMAAWRRGDGDMFDVLDASEAVLEATRSELAGTASWRYQRLRLAAGLGRLQTPTAPSPRLRIPPRRP